MSIEEQNRIDELARKMADDIIDPIPVEKIYQCAKNWVVTALQHHRNEEYYRGEVKRLERLLLEVGRESREVQGPDPDSVVDLKVVR